MKILAKLNGRADGLVNDLQHRKLYWINGIKYVTYVNGNLSSQYVSVYVLKTGISEQTFSYSYPRMEILDKGEKYVLYC